MEALFELLQTCNDEMTLRVAAGAIANLAMSEVNQHRIVEEGGLELLVKLSQTAGDSQTQRMIAGAIANLCGNGKQHPPTHPPTRKRRSRVAAFHCACAARLASTLSSSLRKHMHHGHT